MLAYNALCQLLPAEGSNLHYRIIRFRQPTTSVGSKQVLQIATGLCTNEGVFQQNLIISQPFTGKESIAEVPRFGETYTWRINSGSNSNTAPAKWHHFTTGTGRGADTNLHKLKVTHKAEAFANGYVFVDVMATLYNAKGEPVWYLPQIGADENPEGGVRDLKVTPRNTITFLLRNKPYEITWGGKILWQAPAKAEVSGDSTEYFHHEFTMLRNGHYMIMGNERQISAIPGKPRESEFGTIIEYDAQGRVVWNWKSSGHFAKTAYNYPQKAPEHYDVHANSFCINEKTKELYVSFKSISEVLRVKYPTGITIGVYGQQFTNNQPAGNSLFYEQHSVKVNAKGQLYLFNNNNVDNTAAHFKPKIMVLQPAANSRTKLVTQWEYAYPNLNREQMMRETQLTSGGNVMELPGNCYFASMCSPWANLFIVNTNKKLLWEAIPMRLITHENAWSEYPTYRAFFIPDPETVTKMMTYADE